MNRELYKIQQIGDRLWFLAAMTATHAAALGRDGRGVAIIADETRNITNKMQHIIDQILFGNEEINKPKINDIALQINLLALNAAIESYRLEEKGKQAAVCAEEIRNLAYTLTVEMSDGQLGEKPERMITPWPKTPLSTINKSSEFILFTINGILFEENLDNVEEVLHYIPEHKENYIMLRGRELQVINGYKILGKTINDPTFIILRAPWAEVDHSYAVAVDSIDGLIACPTGTPVAPPTDMPLVGYVRECWENENGEPYYFMDWPKMANKK